MVTDQSIGGGMNGGEGGVGCGGGGVVGAGGIQVLTHCIREEFKERTGAN